MSPFGHPSVARSERLCSRSIKCRYECLRGKLLTLCKQPARHWATVSGEAFIRSSSAGSCKAAVAAAAMVPRHDSTTRNKGSDAMTARRASDPWETVIVAVRRTPKTCCGNHWGKGMKYTKIRRFRTTEKRRTKSIRPPIVVQYFQSTNYLTKYL